MNYQKIYDALISRSKQRTLTGYTERHHIIPRCMGGTNDKNNIAILTAREHFIAHQLLVNIYPEKHGLKYAAYMMTIGPNGQRNNNRLYSWIKESYFENRVQSSGFKGRKHSEETLKKMRAKRKLQVITEETKIKISKTKQGVPLSEEAKASMNEKRNANESWLAARFRPQSESTKLKIGKANKGRVFPQQECPHCGKVGAGPNMKRYHMDNCKFKNRQN